MRNKNNFRRRFAYQNAKRFGTSQKPKVFDASRGAGEERGDGK